MLKYKIYCINLYERVDRYNYMKKQFEELNLKVHFVRNHKHKKGGRYGCFNSHIQCIQDAYNLKLDFYIIFEDDCKIVSNIKELIKLFSDIIKKNKNNIDIIYAENRNLINLTDSTKYNFLYGGKCNCGCGTIITKKFTKKILKKYKLYIGLYNYDCFIREIVSNSFISIKHISKCKPFGSNNSNWGKQNQIACEKITNPIQLLTNYTTIHWVIPYYTIFYLLSNKIKILYNKESIKHLY